MSMDFLATIPANSTRKGRARRILACVSALVCWAGATAQIPGWGGSTTAASQSSPSAAAAAPSEPGVQNTPTTPMAGQSTLYPGEDFKLGPGDLIAVRVFQQPDYQATVRVDLNGNALLPFIGNVSVKGLTVREAQTLVADRLQAGGYYRNPEVEIEVLDTVNGSVIVTGEVHVAVPVATERSLREVLLIAGGLPANASHTIKIVRPGQAEPIVVDLGSDLASSTTANVLVRPHDIIQITRASVVYVLGAFARQGQVPLDQATPLTLLQAVALSGGMGFEAKYEDLRLIRTVGTERKLVDVDAKKVRDGKAPDPILQANDIVFLPTSSMKAVLKNLGVGGVIGLVSLLVAARGL